jgi:arylsulfatase A-like enzyme
MMKRFYFPLLLWMLGLVCAAGATGAESPKRPNIVFILTDDLGWTDLGCAGSKFYETPNIDRLAKQGMRFTDGYSACTVCSPSRASILTGQYPARLHVTDWIAGHARPFAKMNVPDWTMRLLPELPNLAKSLKSVGYATASIGKWHLGPEESSPTRVGFDVNIGGNHRGQPPSYFSPYKIETLQDEKDGEFLSDRLTDEALKFIEANRDRPFFVYLPHFAVHTPLMAKPEVVAKYKARQDPSGAHKNPVYAALLESVDDSVGRLLEKLDALKLSENTIVVFTSDNGGLLGPTSNTPLRAGKGSAYEGGVRVPLIIRWPGVTQPGSVSNVPVTGADFFPTFLAANRLEVPREHAVDGENLLPVLGGAGALKRDTLFWHYPHYHPGGATPYGALREGDWRLVEFFEDHRVELYNLKDDLAEAHDLAAEQPEKAAALKRKLHEWRERVGAQMPTVNPNHDPVKDAPKKNPKGGL